MTDLDNDSIIELTDVVSNDSDMSTLEDVIELTDVIDQGQIEAALERIIEKKFADKIDSVLFDVMENVIEKQIIKIKESLQKELD